jgi:hypothetical protein
MTFETELRTSCTPASTTPRSIWTSSCSAASPMATSWSGAGGWYVGSLDTGVAPAGTHQQQSKAITPRAVLKILLGMLPDATKAKDFSRENAAGTERLSASLEYTDGGSTALVQISFLSERFAPECIKGADLNCQLTTLADGSRLQLVVHRSLGSGGNDKHLQANLYRKDGPCHHAAVGEPRGVQPEHLADPATAQPRAVEGRRPQRSLATATRLRLRQRRRRPLHTSPDRPALDNPRRDQMRAAIAAGLAALPRVWPSSARRRTLDGHTGAALLSRRYAGRRWTGGWRRQCSRRSSGRRTGDRRRGRRWSRTCWLAGSS